MTLSLPVPRRKLVDNGLEGGERAKGLVAVEVVAGGLAAGDHDGSVVVAQAHEVALQRLLFARGEGWGGLAAYGGWFGGGGPEGGEEGCRWFVGGAVGVVVGAEELDGNVACEGGPGVVAEGA